jgi:NADP-dependent 3-hydroxy acid dehydrogenase YdfG
MSVYFITGASRGLGAAIVDAALAAGHQVFATARDASGVLERRPDAGGSLGAASLDVTDHADAGQGLLGAVEEVSDERARAVFDVNVFGVLNVIRAVLPVLRAQ